MLPVDLERDWRELRAAAAEERRRGWDRLANLPRLLRSPRDVPVGTSPHDVVLEMGSMRLLRYRRPGPTVQAPPMLLCYALVNRPYILDLLPDRSVVRRYLEAGFDVYLIDWGVPSAADKGLDVAHYVAKLLHASVEAVKRLHDTRSIHLLGYCMGGTMAALYAALHPEAVRTLTLLSTPIDFSERDSLLKLWTDRRHFDVDAFVDAFGNCPPWFLQYCFLQLKPVQNYLEKSITLYEQSHDERFLEQYFAMERWLNDNIPIAGETFRSFVKDFFQDNRIVGGDYRLGGRLVRLANIECPMLLLTAVHDHLVPPVSTEGIRPHVRSAEVTSMSIEAGHVGLVVGRKAQSTLWQSATRWTQQRSDRTI